MWIWSCHQILKTYPGIKFSHLFEYALFSWHRPKILLAEKAFIEAEDFRDQTLITYPVERSRLDLFSQLLIPAKVEPASIRQVELTAVILLLVASNRGISVLPDWVVREVKYSSDYVTRPLTKEKITRGLFAATRDDDLDKPYMRDLIRLAGEEARRLQSL
jgi:Transcriptional regulator